MEDQDYTGMSLPEVISAAVASFFNNSVFPEDISESDANRIVGEISKLEGERFYDKKWIENLNRLLKEHWDLEAIDKKPAPTVPGM